MARGFNKRTKPSSSAASPTEIPPPFTKAPLTLAPLLDRLDPAQIHLIHIDRHPPAHKRSIFLIPVGLNALIAALLLWRLAHALPKYFTLLQTLLGYTTTLTVDPDRTTRRQQLTILLKRTLMFLGDFLLFRFIGPWPLTFFLEQPANPCTWRWNLGFRQEEIIVRVSRHWGVEELLGGGKKGEESPFFKTRVLTAIEPSFMRKTGYLMMDKSWDLEFEVMQDAHELVKRGDLRIGEIDKLVLAHQDGQGWLCWRWETDDEVVEGRRRKVVQFKEALTGMGKESLFWKWTEIVEEERDVDGGFTRDRQERVARRVGEEFEREGVDFEEVVGRIGGLGEVPTK
ncbi:hypothetical protein M409DRAFT_22012 [Zasmidium cellare ATCC 36951]|uniref:Uncharacterized protein n=1 Tax=Zasmidium cellare ATCC 36951 TaxID=1080233 RepID=A0A6A6CKX8_ZASCE|nr:uncharacterized protein M409DRAFT_22012 [Zasmidium cellare ATCC 36951]KAF2167864.1 hypothetical protein M409DRAFT_22012 [Zasmidium cellare ATCC 36951]